MQHLIQKAREYEASLSASDSSTSTSDTPGYGNAAAVQDMEHELDAETEAELATCALSLYKAADFLETTLKVAFTSMEGFSDAPEVLRHVRSLREMAKSVGGVKKVANAAAIGSTALSLFSSTDGLLAASQARDKEAAMRHMEDFTEDLSTLAGNVPVFGDAYSSVISEMSDTLVYIVGEMTSSWRFEAVCTGPDAHHIPGACEANGYDYDGPVHPKWGPGVVDQ